MLLHQTFTASPPKPSSSSPVIHPPLSVLRRAALRTSGYASTQRADKKVNTTHIREEQRLANRGQEEEEEEEEVLDDDEVAFPTSEHESRYAEDHDDEDVYADFGAIFGIGGAASAPAGQAARVTSPLLGCIGGDDFDDDDDEAAEVLRGFFA
jgi:hypothetical protein